MGTDFLFMKDKKSLVIDGTFFECLFSPPDAACPNALGAAGFGFLQNANERGTECNRGKGCITDAFADKREKERNPF